MGLGTFLLGATAGLLSKRDKKETKRHLFYRGRDIGTVSENAKVGGSEVKDALLAYAKEKDLDIKKMSLDDVEIKDV